MNQRSQIVVQFMALMTAAAMGCSPGSQVIDAGADDGGREDAGVAVWDGSSQTLGTACATQDDAGSGACLGNCSSGEVCFTQVSCGLYGPDSGPGGCYVYPSSAPTADNRCHRSCDGNMACPVGQSCYRVRFFNCTDSNFYPDGFPTCCKSPGCENE